VFFLYVSQGFASDSFFIITYHQVTSDKGEGYPDSISVKELASQFQWLKDQGYVVISIDDVVKARNHEKKLPPKSVLLTFDDGYGDFYTNAWPLLKAFNYPAVIAIVGNWIDGDPSGSVHFGDKHIDKHIFMTWDQIREVSGSGLIEVASHTYHQHIAVNANPQGTQPALVTRIYEPMRKKYETDDAFMKRIKDDFKKNSDVIFKQIGKRPRVMVWPYGRFNEIDVKIANDLGMFINMGLEEKGDTFSDLQSSTNNLNYLKRYYYVSGDGVKVFIDKMNAANKKIEIMRGLHVNLDYIYNPNPKIFEENLVRVVDLVSEYGANTVFLKAYVTPPKGHPIQSVYFPNRHLDVKADIMGKAVWQLEKKAGVEVYGLLSVGKFASSFSESMLKDICEDMAKHTAINGISFLVNDRISSVFKSENKNQKNNDSFIQLIQHVRRNTRIYQPYGKMNIMFDSFVVDEFCEENAQNTRTIQYLENYIDNMTFILPSSMDIDYMDMSGLLPLAKNNPALARKLIFQFEPRDSQEIYNVNYLNLIIKNTKKLTSLGFTSYALFKDFVPKINPDFHVLKEAISTHGQLKKRVGKH